MMTDTAAPSIALALGVSALLTVACRRVRVPALLPLMLAGLALGTSGIGVVNGDSLGPALRGFITVAIGLLIFEGALHLNKQEFARAPRAVWGLLTVGALVTWTGAAAAAHLVLDMTPQVSILLGAALIVTGPTVVQPILRLVRVSPRLHTALSAEAVLIDPIGVVATVSTLEVLRLYLHTGAQASLASEGAWMFVKPLLGGAGIGLVFGILGYALLRAIGRAGRPEPHLLNLVAIGCCMTCVGVGEIITPEAGLAAVTLCGMIMARARVLGATELRAFKELLAIILVGTLFVLLASRFDVGRLLTLSWREGAFVLVLLTAVRPLSVFLSTWRSSLSLPERVFAATFAPRGIVALSVATVAAADLAQLLTSTDAGPATDAGDRLLVDAGRLELVMFVVIGGTVLLASTVSPLLAWLLGVRAGEGQSVILVGGHPMSVALATWLFRHGIESRIIDSNESRVDAAVAAGAHAIAGDATDTRWMDDVGSPHGAGWLLAWTGNHDVDQLAVRWAGERFGHDHAVMWSIKPARGSQEPADVGLGESITDWLDRFGDHEVELAEASDPASLARILGWIHAGRFTLNFPGSAPPGAADNVLFVGLRNSADRP